MTRESCGTTSAAGSTSVDLVALMPGDIEVAKQTMVVPTLGVDAAYEVKSGTTNFNVVVGFRPTR
jgi:hypothetical protein